ncbi:outer membrane protein transport protein [Rhodobacter sp. Har01]|uniref:OmpP1/FadL family transporter n=1 Tax=Rhodobacter sp. Har01 TaxID=2883999 RepID=UPI001D083069|nr:outer membrane protein transport protein [Rhodobacter sp. Har01]MCB6177077.1 outer membrane protein transport protein [Rhodobacter sp. Har01]
MRRLTTSAVALAAAAGAAQAGGLDRTGQGLAFLFETGTYAELTFGFGAPSVSGVAVAGLGGASSGDMAASYSNVAMAYKRDLSDKLALGLVLDQPFGANVDYPAGTGYYAQGSQAELKTMALTAILKYKTPSNISVYGGLRYQTMEAWANVPFVGTYSVEGDRDAALGYLVGVAWEKPEIALRVALTYNSAIEHKLDTVDRSALTGGADVASVTTIEAPQSVNLDVQSGIAKDTLLFGSIRWVDWTSFSIDPAGYPAATPLVSYDNDTVSYSLGLGRRFNENWSGAVTLGYEPSHGGYSSNLGPTDGYWSVGLGTTYTQGNMKVTAGVRYVDIGDAQTQLPVAAPSANFTDNSAIGLGVKVGWSF